MATSNQLNAPSTLVGVTQGGTGVATMTTAYAPICSGSTPTSTVVPASTGLPTSGYILTSNGASATPSFQLPIINKISVTLSTSDIQNMYATPVQILAAQGTHTLIMVYMVTLEFILNTTAFGGGISTLGPVLQYGNTNHAGGVLIFQSQTDFKTASSKMAIGTISAVNSGLNVPTVTGNIINQGIYATNQTAAYTGGNSSCRFTVYYTVLSTTV